VTGGVRAVAGVVASSVVHRRWPSTCTACHTLKSLHIAQLAVTATRRDTCSLDQFGMTAWLVGPKQCDVQFGCCRRGIRPEAPCWKRGDRVFNCGRRRSGLLQRSQKALHNVVRTRFGVASPMGRTTADRTARAAVAHRASTERRGECDLINYNPSSRAASAEIVSPRGLS